MVLTPLPGPRPSGEAVAVASDWRSRPTLTAPEVARLTGLSLADVSALIADGKLRTLTVRGRVLVYVASVRALFEAPEAATPQVSAATARLVERVRARSGEAG